jgi:hypothetical protein
MMSIGKWANGQWPDVHQKLDPETVIHVHFVFFAMGTVSSPKKRKIRENTKKQTVFKPKKPHA